MVCRTGRAGLDRDQAKASPYSRVAAPAVRRCAITPETASHVDTERRAGCRQAEHMAQRDVRPFADRAIL